MSNAIKPYEQQQIERTFDGKRVRTSKEQLSKALAPMFEMFSKMEKMGDETFNMYYMLLCDLDPDKLAAAVMVACQAHEYPTQLITVAAIRKAAASEERTPGPSSVSGALAEARTAHKMFRLPEDEDRRERMERLRQTRGWARYYD